MKVLVTGVAGQLGHDVMNELDRRGIEGIGSDRKRAKVKESTLVAQKILQQFVHSLIFR